MNSVIQDPNTDNEFINRNFFEYGPVTVLARFENQGTVHLQPRGHVALFNMLGREVDRENIQQVNVLPNSIRRIKLELGQKAMFGKYTATLTGIYGSTNEALSYSVSFWVIPWKITSGVGFATLVVLFFLIKARRRLRVALRILLRGN